MVYESILVFFIDTPILHKSRKETRCYRLLTPGLNPAELIYRQPQVRIF